MSITEDHKEGSDLSADRQVYEIGYLVLPSIAEDSLPKVVDSIKKTIQDAGGSVFDGEEPRKRSLAYSMSKVVGSSKYVVNDAYMGWIKFDLPQDTEAEVHPAEVIKKEIEKMDEILRMLLIKAPRESEFTFASLEEPEETEESEGSDDASDSSDDSNASESEDVVE